MTASPLHVDVLVAAYNAEAFLRQTLESLAAQSWPHLRILVSDDCSTDATGAIVGEFAARDRRFILLRQTNNLGWVRNVNALLAAAEADAVCLVSHDDVVEPEYIERLARALMENGSAVLAYSDMTQAVEGFEGRQEQVFAEPAAPGSVAERLRPFVLQQGPWWIAYRGVVRRAAAQAWSLRSHEGGNFKADLPWLLALAAQGPFVRVPGFLYHKRLRTRSISAQWSYELKQERAVRRECVRVLRELGVPARDVEELVVLLRQDTQRLALRYVRYQSFPGVRRMLKTFLGAVKGPRTRQ